MKSRPHIKLRFHNGSHTSQHYFRSRKHHIKANLNDEKELVKDFDKLIGGNGDTKLEPQVIQGRWGAFGQIYAAKLTASSYVKAAIYRGAFGVVTSGVLAAALFLWGNILKAEYKKKKMLNLEVENKIEHMILATLMSFIL